MVDKYRIRSRIEEIRRRVKYLEKDFQPLPEEKLISDHTLYAAAERHLEVAIQATLDIGHHIIAQLGLERPREENKEIFTILAKEDILPRGFAEKLKKMVGYRNVLVHEYLDIERHNTYINIQENLGAFAKFAKYIEKFIMEQEKDVKEFNKTVNLKRIPFKKSKEKR